MPAHAKTSIGNFTIGTIVAVIFFFFSAHAHAGMALKFESVVETQSASDSDSKVKTRSTKSHVLLEDDYFHFTGEEEGIYDFDKKVIYSINRTKAIYSEISLFANVGFRDYELQNRKFLRDALENAGAQKNLMPLIFSEHELSVQARDSSSKVIRQERNSSIVFLGSGLEMLMVAGPIIDIPEQYRKQFVRFFRHRYGGHPSIIDELTTSSGIYTDITIWKRTVGVEKIHLHISSVEETKHVDYSLGGLKLFVDKKNRLFALVERVGGMPDTNRKKIEMKILRNAKHLIEKNDLVGAMLTYLEYTLVTGTQKPPRTENDRALLLNSNEVQDMLAAIQNPKNKEDAVSKIAAMDSIRKKQKKGTHILKIFESNTRASVGEQGIARSLMMEALETNPYIASAWKDLGGFYFQSFEPYEAWTCWDIGRKINPEHPLLSEINDFEDRLQKEHPGFF